MKQYQWLILIISLPGRSGTPRMRIWRALKSHGAGILRDGVYVMPDSEEARALFDAQVVNVEEAGGTAYVLKNITEESDLQNGFVGRFNREADYEEWCTAIEMFLSNLDGLDEPEARRREAGLRRDHETLIRIDYFPGDAKSNTERILGEMAAAVNKRFSPDEPTSHIGQIVSCSIDDFSGRRWATRRDLWVDRVASAWLVKRFIDPEATFLWLQRPGDCPVDAIGFDFDGATFTHVEDFVTFEVLLRSFELHEDPALNKLASLVHYLDVGGLPVPDAAGFVSMLAGVKHKSTDDDELLHGAGTLLDHLYAAYSK